jgi:hypothetical protein
VNIETRCPMWLSRQPSALVYVVIFGTTTSDPESSCPAPDHTGRSCALPFWISQRPMYDHIMTAWPRFTSKSLALPSHDINSSHLLQVFEPRHTNNEMSIRQDKKGKLISSIEHIISYDFTNKNLLWLAL